MRIAHLIMVHKNPAQVERLLLALAHDGADCYLHLDLKADPRAFEHLARLPNVHFTPRRFFVRWASYRFTQAIVECTRDILATGIGYEFINLLSGQDYPLRPAAEVHAFLAAHRGQSFMAFEPENSPWWQHAVSRVEQYHTTYYRFPGQYRLQALVNGLLPKRRFPLPYTLYGGPDGSWWTISAECAAYLVQFLDTHPQLQRFSRFTWGSDEFLPATVLLNSPYRHCIINENYRYIDWSAGGANPRVLTAADFQPLARAPKLYARKFDIEHDAHILDRIDRELLRRQPPEPVYSAA
ncbi:beta-1,6-N-acetylglucosaminyltransferase [Hymenobacter metallicola]|uniref:Peptide O-xylosyltransferase n=1 Tax=Hymenobacter metallicola TaxID=2563114 RepID=A0A4Z0QGQ8_9BACT|nr:beta-1,6-N-acetylglucosaminyltransferase [Hymenobacter metallicola]TGE28666.1 glycosyltransferase [Hymenobacter metallicola]